MEPGANESVSARSYVERGVVGLYDRIDRIDLLFFLRRPECHFVELSLLVVLQPLAIGAQPNTVVATFPEGINGIVRTSGTNVMCGNRL